MVQHTLYRLLRSAPPPALTLYAFGPELRNSITVKVHRVDIHIQERPVGDGEVLTGTGVNVDSEGRLSCGSHCIYSNLFGEATSF